MSGKGARGLSLGWMAALAALVVSSSVASAQDDPGALLELTYTPAPRAQVAVWIEDAGGRFISTLALTEAVAYRGIGNRPGASQMNSGYHWPYGRREGVLPVWAHRRASEPGAQPWKRIIFQDRVSEGNASRSSSDQSTDPYYCLSFDKTTTTREALDAVSCASVFTSDKGRFLNESDVTDGYAEPWADPASGTGRMQALPLTSLYPPRMDATPCSGGEDCFDHADVGDYVEHAREVMPEIDAVTTATAPGFVEQSLLFSVPPSWPAGVYQVLVEINVEGDYNDIWSAGAFQTPTAPLGKWDSWAMMYGYPYRGQPSVVYRVSFELNEVGEATYSTAMPIGRSSWQHWADAYGELESVESMSDDPDGASGSGLDRLQADGEGDRLTLRVETLHTPPAPDPEVDPFMDGPGTLPPDEDPTTGEGGAPAPGVEPGGDGEGGAGGESGAGEAGASGADDPSRTPTHDDGDDDEGAQKPPPTEIEDDESDAVILIADDQSLDGPVGEVRGLELGRHRDALHRHEWITIRFRAARSSRALHEYEVRVATRPIVDETSFIREGRPAKTATTDAEGAVKLMLPTDVAEGKWVSGAIGGLSALTEYHVAVRARDRANRTGPISVARFTTPRRTFSTVTPCFVASASYGTPLAAEVSVLRGVRDRYLLSHAPGRALVAAYYAAGPGLVEMLRQQPWTLSVTRTLLEPIVALSRWLSEDGGGGDGDGERGGGAR